MKYYLIAGEASGDLHASHLMEALKNEDPEAEFRFFGGDCMQAAGGIMVRHYRDMAYMGFIPVLTHLRAIFANMKFCKGDIAAWHPHVVILVDYPGFNLNIASYVRRRAISPVFYYISPKIWAWKEYRIKNIKRDVDEVFSILPFEVDFYRTRHHHTVQYVGNPTVDEVAAFKASYNETATEFAVSHGLPPEPVVALLAGSRKQEIEANLPRMIDAVSSFPGYLPVVAGAPGIDQEFYRRFTEGTKARVLFGETYPLLSHARAAVVTSGTATLETALLGVPQVVCYYMRVGKLMSLLKKLLLKVKYISLVNLIAGREVVKELVADGMTVPRIRSELDLLLHDEDHRRDISEGYAFMASRLGEPGAPGRAAKLMVQFLRRLHAES